MNIFGSQLKEIEERLMKNIVNTKKVFPEETKLLEYGLALMWNAENILRKSYKDFETKPDLFANANLFGRNRELLLNAYFCMLEANYGTQSVILRTVLENNNLMRLFNKEMKYAFEWLPKERQMKFPLDIQKKYYGCKENREYKPFQVREVIFEDNEIVKYGVGNFYNCLCDYAHPNFSGWQEIMGKRGEQEVLVDLPTLSGENASEVLKLTLYMFQLSIKTFYDTFKPYFNGTKIIEFLSIWKLNFDNIMPRYMK